MIRINVIGLPAPQGSKTRMPNGAMVEGGSTTGRVKHKSWRAAVTEAAVDHAQVRGEAIREPVSLSIVFRFPPTKTDPHRLRHCVKPDIDKLQRSTIDALVQARLLYDDSLVWSVEAEKVYADDATPTGASIVIRLDGEAEAAHKQSAKEHAAALRKSARSVA